MKKEYLHKKRVNQENHWTRYLYFESFEWPLEKRNVCGCLGFLRIHRSHNRAESDSGECWEEGWGWGGGGPRYHYHDPKIGGHWSTLGAGLGHKLP